jgi:sugar/nucleoside kinase (ribokinase family)
LTGKRQLLDVYEAIKAMGPRILVVKRGEYGVALFSPEGNFLLPAFPLKDVADPTGAGDTFAGGFMGYLAATANTDLETLKRATMMGTILASFTVEQFGTAGLQALTDNVLHGRLATMRSLIHVA